MPAISPDNPKDKKLHQMADLYISCCTAFRMGEIDKDHWANMMQLFTEELKEYDKIKQ